jgi:hypothetical protein
MIQRRRRSLIYSIHREILIGAPPLGATASRIGVGAPIIDPFRAGSIVACIPTPIQPIRTFPSDFNTETGRSDTCTLLALQEPLSVAALWERCSISSYPFSLYFRSMR